MQSTSPQLVIRSQLTVLESGLGRVRRRSSTGSIPSSSATLSKCVSRAKRGCGVPCPRFGPEGGLFVKSRTPSNRYRGVAYVVACGGPGGEVVGTPLLPRPPPPRELLH